MPAKARLNGRRKPSPGVLPTSMSQRQAYIAAGYDCKGASPMTRLRGCQQMLSECRNCGTRLPGGRRKTRILGRESRRGHCAARECRMPGAMIAGSMGQGKLFGFVIDRAQVEAVVRRPATTPISRPGVILSEEVWQRRIALAAPAATNGRHRYARRDQDNRYRQSAMAVTRKVEIAITPTKRQWDFITYPADQILFGGSRRGAKTTGSLLDFWYHAIEHGPNALGLMVCKQRTDLRPRLESGRPGISPTPV